MRPRVQQGREMFKTLSQRSRSGLKGPPKRMINSASVDSDRCIFCKIARGELPSHKVYEDGQYIAFLDINPSPGGTPSSARRSTARPSGT